MLSSYSKTTMLLGILRALRHCSFILPSIDKAHMQILLLLQNLVELNGANTVLRSHNGYWSEDESSDVPPVATNVDV